MRGDVLLVRHTQVAVAWRGRCYGHTDVALSREGRRQARRVAAEFLRKIEPRGECLAIVHSGLRRAAVLAAVFADLSGAEPTIDPRWCERDFGAWEGRTWHSIWRESGNAMDGMLDKTRSYRPGGGETTAELMMRSWAAWRELPTAPFVIVVTHGGPIACVRARLERANLLALPDYRIPEGSAVRLQRKSSRRARRVTCR